MDETMFYNHHYISIAPDGVILDAWSDGPHYNRVVDDAICFNDEGGYQLRLIIDGELTEENPPIYNFDGIPIYKWDGSKILRRTDEEIAKELAAIPDPPPTQLERIEAQVTYTAMMTETLLEMEE